MWDEAHVCECASLPHGACYARAPLPASPHRGFCTRPPRQGAQQAAPPLGAWRAPAEAPLLSELQRQLSERTRENAALKVRRRHVRPPPTCSEVLDSTVAVAMTESRHTNHAGRLCACAPKTVPRM